MMSFLPTPRALAAIALAITLTACSSPTTPSGGSAAVQGALVGGPWTLVAQQRAGEAEAPPPPGSVFTLEAADGRAAVRADCNSCGGPLSVSRTTVTIGPTLACTRAFCTLSSPYDDAFLRIISGESTATVDGSTLTLRSERGTARFRR